MKIGLYFGTFNPIHIGHLIIAQAALNGSPIQQVWFVVSPSSPDKNYTKLLHEFDRYDLVREAISGNPAMKVSDVEFALPKPSYTYMTLEKLRQKHPEHEFFIIMGSDNYQNLHKWKNVEEIRKQVRFIIYPRNEHESRTNGDDELVHIIDAPLLHISSTYIRQQIKNDKDVRYLLPEDCSRLIREKGFYR